MLNKLLFHKVKVKAGILNTVLVISLVITSLTSAIIFLAYYKNLAIRDYEIKENLLLNASSGIQYLLATDQLQDDQQYPMDLFGKEQDTVILQKKPWGLFNIALSTAQRGRHHTTQIAMYGAYPDQYGKSALYLADENNPLSVAEKNRIVGHCYLPEAGVKTAIVNNIAFSGNKIVEGIIDKSNNELPALEDDFLKRILLYQNPLPQKKSNEIVAKGIPANIKHSFRHDPLVYLQHQSMMLNHHTLEGNIIVSSTHAITIARNARMSNVLIIAPGVVIEEGFQGQIQVFASDSLIVGNNCTLKYPSVLCSYNDSSQAKVLIGRRSQVSGIVYIGGKPTERLGNVLRIEEGAVLMGQIYADALVEHKGTVLGSLICRRFFLNTPSTLFMNYLSNATIDVNKRSKHFITSSLLSSSKRKAVVQWLE